jgi:hypothetical protein
VKIASRISFVSRPDQRDLPGNAIEHLISHSFWIGTMTPEEHFRKVVAKLNVHFSSAFTIWIEPGENLF